MSQRILIIVIYTVPEGNHGCKHLKFINNRNYSLSDYGFLKNMKITSLYIGNNGRKADVSALYELKDVGKLVVEEKILFHLDLEKFRIDYDEMDEGQHYMQVKRWIAEEAHSTDLPTMYSVYPQLYRNKNI